jgi:AAT family amino acid transporter/D-serine/D-alanine/glycine transporter
LVDIIKEEALHEQEDFRRGLKDRHIQLIALGGAIGVGLFLGSASAIQKTGPGLLVAYAIAGVAIFFTMRALGELLLYRPVSGSFASYAEEFVGPWAGFVTGWSYWFLWAVVGIAEITAVGIYTQYWFPDLPQWVPALITVIILYSVNLIAVSVFGEFEFWFALIKVVTIVGLIIFGVAVLLFGFGELGETANLSNLWVHGGFLPTGLLGVVLTLPIATFAFGGVELVGLTAGEAEDPHRVIPHAINQLILRILIFYIGALLVIMSLVPWNQLRTDSSPFVLVFDQIGFPAAAGFINFVVITAAASSCNSGLFSTGRMLYTLAQFRQAPRMFAKVSASHVPAVGITFSAAVMSIGVFLNYLIPERVFGYVISVVLVVVLWTWAMILTAHLGYRRAVAAGRVEASPYRMPGAPVVNYLVLAFLALVLVLLAFDEGTRVALYVGPIWFAILAVGYFVAKSRAKEVLPT